MKITGADHTSYTVSNLERSLEFYVGLLGCELLWQREISNQYFRDIVGFPECVVKAAHLKIPGTDHHIELFEYVAPAGQKADVRTNNVGSSHISFLVEDLPAAYEELLAKGVTLRSPPVEITAGANNGGWGVYLLDPDGITMELFQKYTEHSRERALRETGLSDEERRILRLLATGASNAKIAAELYLSETTVKRKLQDIFEKLDVTTRAQAAAEAVRRGVA